MFSLLVKYDSVTGNVIPEISVLDALIYALVGFVVTFIGIIILLFFIGASGKIIKKAEASLKSRRSAKKPVAEQQDVPATDGAEAVKDEVRVAIIAAIAAYYAAENSTCEFKVKRIKRL